MAKVLLVHGGFAPIHTGSWFWTETGVTPGLEAKGFAVSVPDRAHQPASWLEEGDHLATLLVNAGGDAVIAVGASNGCSAAARLALDHRDLVAGLILCWPATAGDAEVDRASRAVMVDFGIDEEHLDQLYSGDTLRGVRDDELATIGCPLVIIPSDPFNPQHQERTVQALVAIVPNTVIGAPSPEAPMSYFAPRRAAFLDDLAGHLARIG